MNGTTPSDAGIPASPRSPGRFQIFWGVAILIVIAAGTAWYLSAWRALFFHAIRSNSVGLARTMLKMGTDANAPLDGESPLRMALDSSSPFLATVQLLLEFHADPNRLDTHGMAAPLEKVHGPDAFAIFDALLAAGANIKACSRSGSILHHAWSLPYAKFILSRGADVNLVCETTGTSPLIDVV